MTTIELIQARINHAAVNSKPEVEDSLKELLQAVLKEMPLGCPSSGLAETPRTEENKYESVMAQLRRENQSYSHEIGILRKHRAYQPDGEPVFQHTFDELLARAEAAEAEVARLTKERDAKDAFGGRAMNLLGSLGINKFQIIGHADNDEDTALEIGIKKLASERDSLRIQLKQVEDKK